MYVGLQAKPPRPYKRSEELLWAVVEKKDKVAGRYEWDSDQEVVGSSSKALDGYDIVTLPEKGYWEEIAPKLWFSHNEYDTSPDQDKEGSKMKDSKGKQRHTKRSVCIQSTRADNPEGHVEEFIREAFTWYRKRRADQEDKGRFMYQIYQPPGGGKKKSPGDDEDLPVGTRLYKRYKLADDRTFDTLFIPGKKELLGLVDAFLQKQGNFAKPGFPDKLGLLLHGPPGTGKTSLIKCLAQYTKRHIVNINLARVSTNQELMDLMYDCSFRVLHEDEPRKLDWDQVIFVMEDIDCATDVIKARKLPPGLAPDKPGGELEKRKSVRFAAGRRQVVKARRKSWGGAGDTQGLPRASTYGSPAARKGEDASDGEEEDEDDGGAFPRCVTDYAGRELTLIARTGSSMESGNKSDKEEGKEDGDDGDEKGDEKKEKPEPESLTKAFDACAESAGLAVPAKGDEATPEDGAEQDKGWGWAAFVANVEKELGSLQALQKLGYYDEDTLKAVAQEWFERLQQAGTKLSIMRKGRAQAELISWAQDWDAGSAASDGGSSDEGDSDDGKKKGQGKKKKGKGGSDSGSDAESDSDESEDDKPSKEEQGADKLNLAGLLNVLDGVVDTPGRIVVMTTNVRQKLDPALIRPGRVNQRLELGYMQEREAMQMISHYLEGEADPETLRPVWRDGQVTPAQLEQLCIENSDIDGIAASLRKRFAASDALPKQA
eukprot:TRINITY_DN22107_c0_g2_i1.p1 TRINITY_DN22107_c0_g2~~TRINITY_DN22107_c0_g2_i1.p1  ORF type:complete len:715 (+),score=269.66 TRINITY_DN22107_c0_g2_i1:377-2521(+)